MTVTEFVLHCWRHGLDTMRIVDELAARDLAFPEHDVVRRLHRALDAERAAATA